MGLSYTWNNSCKVTYFLHRKFVINLTAKIISLNAISLIENELVLLNQSNKKWTTISKYLAEVIWPFYFSNIIYLRYFSYIVFFFSSIEMQVVKNGNCPLIKQKTINNERERKY